MHPGLPSRTLLGAAIRRAQHQLLDAPAILNDSVIVKLVPEACDPAVLPEFGAPDQPVPILMRSLFAMRSRFAEDRLAQAMARGLRQYVILGAGLDTFPWRQPDFARDMQIFAVDHPASLIWTQRRLRERGFTRPSNLVHVPVDLEEKSLAEHLAACGFDTERAAFCSALGLMQYLEAGVADDLLHFVASLAPSSEIVFSFVQPDDELEGPDLAATRHGMARAIGLGEPWKNRLRPRDMADRVTRLGFSDIFHLAPELAQARYFAGRTDQLRAPRFEQLMSAIV